jgi:uroporphyrin-III C-methyltransferase
LVGAGPGDPDLLTVKALRLIQGTDVVVYDRLVSEEILALIPSGVSRIFVGKAHGSHPMPQEDINRLLVHLARGGRRVVRLKGGDPFVFGRGGEEAEHLARHGIAFDVVPGVTAATACAAYAGIPLTHRGLSTGVRFVTGHCRGDTPLDLDWEGLVDADTTLVVYMGLAQIGEISARLMAAGLDRVTPAAAIERGTTRCQRRILTTLEALPAAVAAHALEAPTTFVIGRVVALAQTLDWFAPAAVPGSDMDAPGGVSAYG